LFRNALSREITAVLVFKALALTALYFAFFAGPAPHDGAAIFRAPAAHGAGPAGASAP